jgi:hypothetical protein
MEETMRTNDNFRQGLIQAVGRRRCKKLLPLLTEDLNAGASIVGAFSEQLGKQMLIVTTHSVTCVEFKLIRVRQKFFVRATNITSVGHGANRFAGTLFFDIVIKTGSRSQMFTLGGIRAQGPYNAGEFRLAQHLEVQVKRIAALIREAADSAEQKKPEPRTPAVSKRTRGKP